MRYKKGQSGNLKGCPKEKANGGRPPDWLKQKCQSLVDKRKLIEFLANVAEGKDVEQRINENGECLKVPADIKDRIKATEILIERGFGKAVQGLELSGTNGQQLVIVRSENAG